MYVNDLDGLQREDAILRENAIFAAPSVASN
eukprot:COSAG01_NODE_17121_length_1175_cov_54.800371_2_plen_30_part_01